MRATLTAVLVLGLCGLAGAQDKKADPVGTWKCKYEVNGEPRESTLAIKKDGDKLAGTMTYQDKQESKLADLKFNDGELTFTAERELMDTKFPIQYKLKVEGDKISGKAMAEFDDRKVELDIQGEREKDK